MALYEVITPVIPVLPPTPDVGVFDGAVMLRCGPRGGPYNNLQLPANPDQELTTDFRVTMTQTLYGVYFDDYGKGIQDLVLRGNTAWISPKGMYNGTPISGYDAGRRLQWDIIDFYFKGEHDKSNPQDMELLIFDYTMNASWEVKPVGKMQVIRSKESPMTINYMVPFKIIKDKVNDKASPDFKPDDPVQSLVVGTTSTPQTSASVNADALAAITAATPSTPPSSVSAAVQASQSVSQAPAQTYTVVSGDTLWGISKTYYGDGSLWHTIYNANTNIISNPNLIFPHQVLTIPPSPNANSS